MRPELFLLILLGVAGLVVLWPAAVVGTYLDLCRENVRRPLLWALVLGIGIPLSVPLLMLWSGVWVR